jgi:hypothetical protein
MLQEGISRQSFYNLLVSWTGLLYLFAAMQSGHNAISMYNVPVHQVATHNPILLRPGLSSSRVTSYDTPLTPIGELCMVALSNNRSAAHVPQVPLRLPQY